MRLLVALALPGLAFSWLLELVPATSCDSDPWTGGNLLNLLNVVPPCPSSALTDLAWALPAVVFVGLGLGIAAAVSRQSTQS